MKSKYTKQIVQAVLFLTVAVILVYYPILDNDFMNQWDDQWQVITKTTENGLTQDNIIHIFSRPFHNQYFPVNQLLYTIIYTIIGGYKAAGFHLFCLIIHLLNTLLVFTVFVQLLNQIKQTSDICIIPVSFVTALLFAIHPLNVESVAWVSASKVLVYAFFYLLALSAYLLYTSTHKKRYFFLTILFFLLSFGGKEQAVILPVCLVIIDWAIGRNMKSGYIWIEKISFFLIGFILGCITLYLSHSNISSLSGGYVLWERIIFGCYSYIEYLFKWVCPICLLYLYPFPSLPGEPIPEWMLWYPLLITIIGYTFKKVLAYWPVTLGLLFFTVNLFMTLHFIPMPRLAIVADRYIYVASIGLSFIVAYYFIMIFIKWKQYNFFHILIFSLLTLYLSGYANLRTHIWHDSNSLKKEVKELVNHQK